MFITLGNIGSVVGIGSVVVQLGFDSTLNYAWSLLNANPPQHSVVRKLIFHNEYTYFRC